MRTDESEIDARRQKRSECERSNANWDWSKRVWGFFQWLRANAEADVTIILSIQLGSQLDLERSQFALRKCSHSDFPSESDIPLFGIPNSLLPNYFILIDIDETKGFLPFRKLKWHVKITMILVLSSHDVKFSSWLSHQFDKINKTLVITWPARRYESYRLLSITSCARSLSLSSHGVREMEQR